jgi:PAS domain S-box-containing protein
MAMTARGGEAGAWMQALASAALDAVVACDAEGVIRVWNGAAARLYALPAAHALGQRGGELVRGPGWRLGDGPEPPPGPALRLRADGGEVPVHACVRRVTTDDGRLCGWLEVARPLASDADEAVRYRQLVDSASDAIVAVDAQQRIRVFNPAAEALFGHRADDVLGAPLDLLIPPEQQRRHRHDVDGFASTGQGLRRMGGAGREVMALRADGKRLPVEATVSRSGQGDTLLLTAVLRDVSALREAEAARRAAREEQAANQARSAFLARMTHELRTPLNAVLGFAQLLDADPSGLPASARSHIRHIRSAGAHLLVLIDDLLDLARIEAGQLRIRRQPVALAPLMRAVAAELEPLAERLRVQVRLGRVPPAAVDADPTRLRQILYNLLSNAIKYNRAEGTTDVEVLLQHTEVEVCIRDSGQGLTAEQVAHLFEPFNRLGADEAGIPGTGLGLAVTQQLVQLMGGRLAIDSAPGRGTRICFTLPAATAGHPAPPPTAPAAPPDDVGGHVLCVEDNPINRLLVEAMLSNWPGVRLSFADTLAEATRRCSAQAPDLVLLDLLLPDGHGLDWLERARGQDWGRKLPVFVLSASLLDSDRRRADALGARGFLSKPLELDAFRRAVQATLVEPRPPPAPQGPKAT